MTNKSSLSYLYASKSLLPFESIDFGILITPLLSQITTNSSPAWISSARDPRISRLLKIQGSPETTPTPDRPPGRAKSVLNTSEEDLAMRGSAASRARPHTPPPRTTGCRRPPGPPDRSETGSVPWTGRRRRGHSLPATPSAPAPWPPPCWDPADAVDTAVRPLGAVKGDA